MADLLVRDAERLVTMTGDEIVGGWVAVTDGLVAAVGEAGTEPAAAQAVSARGCLVTPGLINTHHHIFQNLTRAFAPAVNATLFDWLSTLYPLWSRLDEEAAHVSAWIGLAELALGGCPTTTASALRASGGARSSTSRRSAGPARRFGLPTASIRTRRRFAVSAAGVRALPTSRARTCCSPAGSRP